MMPKCLIYILLLCVWSCRQPIQHIPKRNNKINSLVITADGCYGTCPQFTIKIDSDLHVSFFGQRYTNKIGFFRGKITAGFWDSLNMKFEGVGFEHLDSLYERTIDDLALAMTAVYSDHRKTVVAQFDDLPDSVKPTVQWLLNVYKQINLAPAPDTSHFSERFVRPLAPPPPLMVPPKVTMQSRKYKVMHFRSVFGNFTMNAPQYWRHFKVDTMGSFDGKIAIGGQDTLHFEFGFWVSHLLHGKLKSVSTEDTYLPTTLYPHKIDGCVAYTQQRQDTDTTVSRIYIDSIYSIGPVVMKLDFYGSHLSKQHERTFDQVAKTIKFERMKVQITSD